MGTPTPRDVICFSSQPWNDRFWTNKQHIMSRIADRGWRVLYVDPPALAAARLKRRLRQARKMLGVTPVRDRVWVCKPVLASRGETDGFGLVQGVVLRLAARRLGMKDPVLWVYHPVMAPALAAFPRATVLYDCVDEYSALPQFASHAQKIQKLEERLLRRADVVTTSSATLFEAKSRLNPCTHLVENVADFDHFVRTPEAKPDARFEALPRPRVGFVGAISTHKIDAELVAACAAMKKDWSFVFVGGEIDGREVMETCAPLENVHFSGHVDYEKLPNTMACFDLLWIPYGLNDYTRCVFPIKFFEYLASGKPVATTPIPALQKYAHLVEVADGAEKLVKALESALASETPEKRSRRVAAAQGCTWNHRIDRILEVLRDQGR
ncbi:MAG: glycosyltransferase [Deltaproteobacteria bacterium]|nr:glycosyltransferase [Deltaproteobacteria bacterium]